MNSALLYVFEARRSRRYSRNVPQVVGDGMMPLSPCSSRNPDIETRFSFTRLSGRTLSLIVFAALVDQKPVLCEQ